MSQHELTRRKLLAGSAAVTLATTRRAATAAAANDRIQVGLIGCGIRGQSLLQSLAAQHQNANVAVTAVCDVWRPARERFASRVKDSFGASPEAYSRYPDLLASKRVDAVVITTPDFGHSRILADAAHLKKDAYCEKPMAHTLAAANEALRSVRSNHTVVQIGTQRRSEGRYAAAVEFIRSGGLGKIVSIETAWHDQKPRWRRDVSDVMQQDVDWEAFVLDAPRRSFDPRRLRCWQLYTDYTVGIPGLLGSHLIDAACWMTGDAYPTSGICHGGTYVWKDREHADTIECVWEYPGGYLLRFSSRLGNSRRGAELTVYGTRGTFDTESWTASPTGGGVDRLAEPIKMEPRPDHDHVRNWLDCIRSRRDPNAPVESGHAHSVAAIMAFQSLKTGKRLVWNAKSHTMDSG